MFGQSVHVLLLWFPIKVDYSVTAEYHVELMIQRKGFLEQIEFSESEVFSQSATYSI